MFQLNEVWDELKGIIGRCDDERAFRWAGDALSLIVSKSDVEGLKGTLDICSAGCSCSGERPCSQNCGRMCLTMPREVATVLAVNIGGRPALGYAQLFNFHLNGPGDCRIACDWSWQDLGAFYSTFRDLLTPAPLVAYLQTPLDNNKQLIVYGYDSNGQVLRREVNGVWQNGILIPTIYGSAIPDADAPDVARITGIFKEPTVGSVRLSTIDDSGATGVLLGVFEPDETVPQYRRIQLNRCCKWARVTYLKNALTFSSRYDHVPLWSRRGFLLAVSAVKKYSEEQLDLAHAFEADAARLEIEAQQKLEAPLFFPIQVVDRNSLRDKDDYCVD